MQKKQKHGIVWFRNNLRVADHRSLNEAITSCSSVTGVYFFDPDLFRKTRWGFPKTGRHRLRFLLETLKDLQEALQKLNIPLHFETSAPATTLPTLAGKWQADAIFTQKEWTTEEAGANNLIRTSTDIPFIEHYDQFLIHPSDLPFNPMELPEVFTAFRKAVEASWYVRPITPVNREVKKWKNLHGLNPVLPTSEALGLNNLSSDPRTAFPFKGGTTQALARITDYFWTSKKLQYYKRTRNGLVGTDYSSKLSPWLANGSISPRMVYAEVKAFEKQVISNRDTYWLIFELLWRDYFKYISLKHGNHVFRPGGIRQLDEKWPFDKQLFSRWINGNTGNDFVDANMIELERTGWMSNRGRQNAASYWAKDLKQDWRAGAAWFENKLLDYDVHSNWGNWNYISGVGNDPRDRKFNTRTQAERYDTSGTFRKLWLQNTLF